MFKMHFWGELQTRVVNVDWFHLFGLVHIGLILNFTNQVDLWASSTHIAQALHTN